MDQDYNGAMGRAMGEAYAREAGLEAQRQNATLAQRVARLERLFVLATMGGKDAAAETNKILQQLIKDAGA